MSEDMDAAVTDALGQYQCISTLTAENERLRKRVAELRRALGKISKDTFCLGPWCPYCAAETDHPSSYAAKVARAALEDKA